MLVKELLEGRHPHRQYYRAKPKSQFKQKPRPKKTLWYNDYPNWVSDIQTRFPDSQAYYDEENEQIIAGCPSCKDIYGRWDKNGKEFKGVSFENPRSLLSVSKNGKKLKKMDQDTTAQSSGLF